MSPSAEYVVMQQAAKDKKLHHLEGYQNNSQVYG